MRVDLSKPITKWDIYKLALAMWALKGIFWSLDLLIRFGNWCQNTYVGRKMNEFYEFIQQDLWNEFFLPLFLLVFLLVGLWVANDMSCTLPHYQ